LTVATTGNNESQLKKLGIKYQKSIVHPNSHASYYPGALPLSIKLIFTPDNGKILGAQVIGYEGADKRIDVISTAMRADMTVYDLEKLELAYAPPYSAAKDPVNMAGFVAANILRGDCDVIHWNEIDKRDKDKTVLIDVRTPVEYNIGTIEGAVNIPLDDLRERLDEIPKDKDIIIFCQVGLRGYIACRILKQHGFANVKNLSGGYRTYEVATSRQTNEVMFQYDDSFNTTRIEESHKEQLPGQTSVNTIEIDACGLQCPGPIIQVYNAMQTMKAGDILQVKASDPGFENDIKVWCERTGHKLLDLNWQGKTIVARIQKSAEQPIAQQAAAEQSHDKAMIIFSGDLDKAIASFIIANGAAAMGRKVTMFFTFWGLNILRKPEKVPVQKDFISKMFGAMMPRGSLKLSLSRMNMFGIGPKLIRHLMKQKNILSLEELMQQAIKNGVRIVACNMSMDIMGIKPEELIDGVEIGGVASFIGAAEQSDTSLFI